MSYSGSAEDGGVRIVEVADRRPERLVLREPK
jgi:hypothetical protein